MIKKLNLDLFNIKKKNNKLDLCDISKAVYNMTYILKKCNVYSLPNPKVIPLSYGDNVTLLWKKEKKGSLEILITNENISGVFNKNQQKIFCTFQTIEDTFKFILLFLPELL